MEIEKKYRLRELPLDLENGESILQGYIVAEKDEARLRRKGGQCFLTCKNDGTLSREEWEVEIPEWVFDILWQKTEGRRIEKFRYSKKMPFGLTLEVDIYLNHLKGLITLEVEFPSEASANSFTLPEGIQGEDVTCDKRYKNKNLALYGLPKD